MQKQMTRKEFLGTMALGMGSIMGFSTIIHLLTGKQLVHGGTDKSFGYGNSPYGGGKESDRLTKVATSAPKRLV